MKNPLTKAEVGPRKNWAEWRQKRDRALANPRRNKAAQELAAPKPKAEDKAQ